MKVSVAIGILAGIVTLGATAGGYHVFMDDRHAHSEDVELAQAQTAVDLQVLAKESRLRDIEIELREIENRKANNDPWKGDEDRYRKLLDDRNTLISRLEQLK
jgi:hypothetical protein